MVSDRKKKRTVASTDVDFKIKADQDSNDEGPSPKKAKKNSPVKKKLAVKPVKKIKKEEALAMWPEADLQELIRKIEVNIPPKDNLRHNSRADRFTWESVAFGNYTPAQCKAMWLNISSRLRRFRLLKELVEEAKVWVLQPWTNFYRSNKRNRHPAQPKRPLSTYMLYYMEKKDKVSKESPNLEMTELSQKIAAMYNNLPDKQKQKYVNKAAQQRREYEIKLEAFYKEYPELVPRASKREKTTSKTYPGPTKPRTPFELYLAEKSEKHEQDSTSNKMTKKDLKDHYRLQWKELSEKKKINWINAALEDQVRYQEDLRAYVEENPEFSPPTLKPTLTKSETNLKERHSGKPEKPPNSGYSLFSRIMLVSDEIKTVESKQRMTQISSMWSNLSVKDKQKYQEKVQQMLEQYKLDFATYLESLSPEKKEEELQASQHRKKPTTTVRKQRQVKKEVEEEEEEDDDESSDVDARDDSPPLVSKTKKAKSSVAATSKKPNGAEEKASMKLFRGEPEPPPVMAYKLFLKSFMSEAKHIPAENRMKEAPRYWQMLPDSEKATFRKKLLELKQKYIADYEKFLKSLSQEQLKDYSLLKSNSKQTEESQDEDSDAESASDNDEDDDDDDKSDEDSDSGGSTSGSASDSDSSASGSASASDSDSD